LKPSSGNTIGLMFSREEGEEYLRQPLPQFAIYAATQSKKNVKLIEER